MALFFLTVKIPPSLSPAERWTRLVEPLVSSRYLPVTDAGLKELAGCKQFQRLSAVQCKRLTDVALKELAACKQLQTLLLVGCGKVTDAGLKKLAAHKQLQSLALGGEVESSGAPVDGQLAGHCRFAALVDRERVRVDHEKAARIALAGRTALLDVGKLPGAGEGLRID
jgi:hypothetical protein